MAQINDIKKEELDEYIKMRRKAELKQESFILYFIPVFVTIFFCIFFGTLGIIINEHVEIYNLGVYIAIFLAGISSLLFHILYDPKDIILGQESFEIDDIIRKKYILEYRDYLEQLKIKEKKNKEAERLLKNIK